MKKKPVIAAVSAAPVARKRTPAAPPAVIPAPQAMPPRTTRPATPVADIPTTIPPATPMPASAPVEPQSSPRLEPSRRVEVRSADQIQGTLNDVNALLKRVSNARLDDAGREALARARSLIRLSEDAIKRGEFDQGDDLAQRAATIARDLANHR